MRNLIIILGDQLNADSVAFDGFDPNADAVWMAEVEQESLKVWSSKQRITVFLSAMRHFAGGLRSKGWNVFYRELTDTGARWKGGDLHGIMDHEETLAAALCAFTKRLNPSRWIMVEPGEWGVRNEINEASIRAGVPLEIREDQHFLCNHAEFETHAKGRKQLRMEFFYREMRQRHGVLMEGGKPVGGMWNFDSENRKSFGKEGPPLHFPPCRFEPDSITREVMAMVSVRFGAHPGEIAEFDWPVTAEDANRALDDFVAHRLSEFGDWQDAMWTLEPWLFHSRLSAAMNLKLLNPRRVIEVAERAWKDGAAPLSGVEGFIRQILGWREYVRGIYWLKMPSYVELNALGAEHSLPNFYWSGETEMVCLRDSLEQTLRLGYAHHIQRLMVTGLYALMFGVNPREVHQWYLAVYVDAVEWVELPNTLGMSQYADGGLMASKPYIATGKYIQRMSNYCSGCRFDPAQSTGASACPFTTLYWDFLLRHESALRLNPRMSMQLKNLARLDEAKRDAIRFQATQHRAGVSCQEDGSRVKALG